MASAKQAILDLLKGLPDDASLEDIQYHLYVIQRVHNGLQEGDDGKVMPDEEMEKRFAKWNVPKRGPSLLPTSLMPQLRIGLRPPGSLPPASLRKSGCQNSAVVEGGDLAQSTSF